MSGRVGQYLGAYQLVHLLGRGGFSEVYLSEHQHLRTQAAIKILLTSIAGAKEHGFLVEARTIAHLEHPHIIRILDFAVQDGTPFLVMNYAPNGTARQYYPPGVCVPLALVVEHVKQVADALQYAHEHKIIHRDIKPENMLLGQRDELLLSDFGIAVLALTTHFQSPQRAIGTLPYMAPEQLQGRACFASDQYALAVVAYEWLCGERPFRGTSPELYSQHLTVPPPSLCEKVPDVPPEIEQVLFKALAKDPWQRFESINAFATALEQASHPQISSLLQNSSVHPVAPFLFLPAHNSLTPVVPSQPVSFTSAMTVPVEDVPSLADQAHQARPFYELARLAPSLPPAYTPVDVGAMQNSRVDVAATKNKRNRRDTPARLGWKVSRRTLIGGSIGVGVVLLAGGGTWALLSLWPRSHGGKPPLTDHGHAPLPKPPAKHTAHADEQHEGQLVYSYHGHAKGVEALTWSPDGQRVASGSDDATVQVWNATNGGASFTYQGHTKIVYAVAWSPDGTQIASGSADRTTQVWNAADGGALYTNTGHTDAVVGVAWSSDGMRLASGSADKTVQIRNAADRTLLYTYTGHTKGVIAVAWSPDGIRLASTGHDNTVQVWNAVNGGASFTYQGHTDAVFEAAWSPDGTRIASASGDGTVQIWDATNGTPILTYTGHKNAVYWVGWSPDGTRIASGSGDGTVQVWNAADGGGRYIYTGHKSTVFTVMWSPDGTRLASGSKDTTAQVWQA